MAMDDKDWQKLKFVPRAEGWFAEGSEVLLKADHTTWNDDMLIDDGTGNFSGFVDGGGMDESEV